MPPWLRLWVTLTVSLWRRLSQRCRRPRRRRFRNRRQRLPRLNRNQLLRRPAPAQPIRRPLLTVLIFGMIEQRLWDVVENGGFLAGENSVNCGENRCCA